MTVQSGDWALEVLAGASSLTDSNPFNLHRISPQIEDRPVIQQPLPQSDGLDPAAPGGDFTPQGGGQSVATDPLTLDPVVPGQPVPHVKGPDLDTTTIASRQGTNMTGFDVHAALWDEAVRDVDAEQAQARLIRGKVAAAHYWPYLSEARSEADFGHRLALIEDRIVVDDETRPAVLASLAADWKSLTASRQEDAQRARDALLAEQQRLAAIEAARPKPPQVGQDFYHVASGKWIKVEADFAHKPVDEAAERDDQSFASGHAHGLAGSAPWSDNDHYRAGHERGMAEGGHTATGAFTPDPSDAARYNRYPVPAQVPVGGSITSGGTNIGPDGFPLDVAVGEDRTPEAYARQTTPGPWVVTPGTEWKQPGNAAGGAVMASSTDGTGYDPSALAQANPNYFSQGTEGVAGEPTFPENPSSAIEPKTNNPFEDYYGPAPTQSGGSQMGTVDGQRISEASRGRHPFGSAEAHLLGEVWDTLRPHPGLANHPAVQQADGQYADSVARYQQWLAEHPEFDPSPDGPREEDHQKVAGTDGRIVGHCDKCDQPVRIHTGDGAPSHYRHLHNNSVRCSDPKTAANEHIHAGNPTGISPEEARNAGYAHYWDRDPARAYLGGDSIDTPHRRAFPEEWDTGFEVARNEDRQGKTSSYIDEIMDQHHIPRGGETSQTETGGPAHVQIGHRGNYMAVCPHCGVISSDSRSHFDAETDAEDHNDRRHAARGQFFSAEGHLLTAGEKPAPDFKPNVPIPGETDNDAGGSDQSPQDDATNMNAMAKFTRGGGRKVLSETRARPTMDNPSGAGDEFDANTWDAQVRQRPMQTAQDRGINTPTRPSSPVPVMDTDSPRQNDEDEDESSMRTGLLSSIAELMEI